VTTAPRHRTALPFVVALPSVLGLLGSAQAAQGTRADYERALGLREAWIGKVDVFPEELGWSADGKGLWWSRERLDGTREFRWVDLETGEELPAFDARLAADALGANVGRALDPARLPVELEDVADERASVLLRLDGRRWRLSASGDLRPADHEAPELAPLGRSRASRGGGEETRITFENRTPEVLRLVWIDTDGESHEYGDVQPGSERVQHTYAGHAWELIDPAGVVRGRFVARSASTRAVVEPEPPRSERALAGGATGDGRADGSEAAPRRRRARLVDDDVVVVEPDGTEVPLTDDGTPDDPYRPPFLWSPDRSRLLAMRIAPPEEHEVTLVESAPRDGVQPKVHTLSYLKPGDRIARPRPRLFDVGAGREIPVPEEPFADAWSVGEAHWAPDGSRAYVVYARRGFQLQRVVAIDAATGEVTTVVEEARDTFVDVTQKTWLSWLDDTGELLWASERSGWNHLWRIDLATGAAVPVTSGEWVVRRVERVDEEAREIWFTALGIRPGQDPYHAHLARVSFDGTGLVVLTEGDGTHEWEFSPDGRFFVDRWSRVDHPTVVELRRARDGSLVRELGRDDPTALLAAGWRPPERFSAPGRDGTTPIWGILIRPSDFDPAQRYPVIEDVYAGPHDFHVPKAWGLGLRQRTLAELGFVVVQIDGMGTNWRSKAFHDVCWRDLADGGFPDRIAWMRAAAATRPELDLERVGIFGGSAGGQSALAALLHHGDFYRAAVADCGCHDNRMDKLWWNEAWMGWPVGPWYAESSNVTHAAKLEGDLLLSVGELDRNVDPASTMQVVDALIRADKDFDLVVVPGGGHGVGETPYLVRRRMDFFVRHLLGVEPRRP